MALQRRATATNNDGGTAGLSAVVTKPTGTLQGDVIYAFIGIADGVAGLTVSAPDGTWTQLLNYNYDASGSQHLDIWYKTAGASEPTSYTFTYTGTTGGATQAWCTIAASYYSNTTGDSVAVDQQQTGGVTEPAGGTNQSPSITPSVNNCRVVSCFCLDESATSPPSWTASSPAGMSVLAQVTETTTNFGMCICEDDQTTATADSHTLTQSGGDTNRGPLTFIMSLKEVVVVEPHPYLNVTIR